MGWSILGMGICRIITVSLLKWGVCKSSPKILLQNVLVRSLLQIALWVGVWEKTRRFRVAFLSSRSIFSHHIAPCCLWNHDFCIFGKVSPARFTLVTINLLYVKLYGSRLGLLKGHIVAFNGGRLPIFLRHNIFDHFNVKFLVTTTICRYFVFFWLPRRRSWCCKPAPFWSHLST